MISEVKISDGRMIQLVDLDQVTPIQGLTLATAVADVLIRSGMTRDDVPLSGPHLLQFLSELGDHLVASQSSKMTNDDRDDAFEEAIVQLYRFESDTDRARAKEAVGIARLRLTQRPAKPCDTRFIAGTMQLESSKCGLRFMEVGVMEPYPHEVRLTIEATPDQDDNILSDRLIDLCEIPVTIAAKLVDGDLRCTTNDITPA